MQKVIIGLVKSVLNLRFDAKTNSYCCTAFTTRLTLKKKFQDYPWTYLRRGSLIIMASISQAESETAPETFSELLSVLAKSASLQSLNVPFREKSASKADTFDKVFVDIKHLEEEIEALKWLARRKEMEWDCTRQMIHQKKADIKVVKRKINMVKTVNDLGEQVRAAATEPRYSNKGSSFSCIFLYLAPSVQFKTCWVFCTRFF